MYVCSRRCCFCVGGDLYMLFFADSVFVFVCCFVGDERDL